MGLKKAISEETAFISIELQNFYRKKGFAIELITSKALQKNNELSCYTGSIYWTFVKSQILPKKLLEYGYIYKWGSFENLLQEIYFNKQ